MVENKSLSAERIAEKRSKYGKDPAIMESMIHALYLLEQLKITGLDFIFKGGTSLTKAYGIGSRFSEDIDIAISEAWTLSGNQLKMLIKRTAWSS